MARLLFTATSGGVSQGNFATLNLGLHVGDDSACVNENRKRLGTLISSTELVFMDQQHGNKVAVIETRDTTVQPVDALVTKEKNLGLVVQVADCLPVLISGTDVVAALHVGRRGMENGLIANTINIMRELSDSPLRARIGPGVCAECYEVDEETYSEISTKFPQADAGFRHLDIQGGSAAQLRMLEVEVALIKKCTKENQSYFSFRRNKVTGRQAGVISL